jgi:hypothetical protein
MLAYMKPFNDCIHAENQHAQTINPSNRYSKPTRLIERAATNPSAVIAAIFAEITLEDLTEDLLPNWLQVAVTNRASPYAESNGQEILTEFYE